MSLFSIPIMPEWTGKTIIDIDVRKKYNLNILAIKENDQLIPVPGGQYAFKENDHIIVLGKPEDVFKAAKKTVIK